MSCAAPRVEKRSSGSASSTGRPRTWSATRRALRGATRTKRARALTTGRSDDPEAVFVAADFVLGFGWSFALLSLLAVSFLGAAFFAAGSLPAAFFAGA